MWEYEAKGTAGCTCGKVVWLLPRLPQRRACTQLDLNLDSLSERPVPLPLSHGCSFCGTSAKSWHAAIDTRHNTTQCTVQCATDHRAANGKLVMRRVEAERDDPRLNRLFCRDQRVITANHQLTQDTIFTAGIQHLLVHGNVTEQSSCWPKQWFAQFCNINEAGAVFVCSQLNAYSWTSYKVIVHECV